ncbi:hypothetical protein BHM03_00038054 [Ensete ventricosum]|nr:hypothetical protein BHM03_00038054 [Ensete ventricosum]
MHLLEISKYWSFPTYYVMGSHMSMVSQKNATVINFAQCHVSICFEHGISKG